MAASSRGPNVVAVPWLAAASLAVFLIVAFPLRSAIGGRRHGRYAGLGLDVRRPRSWWIADALFVAGFSMQLAGAAMQGSDALGAVVDHGFVADVIGILLLTGAMILLVWAQETMGRSWRPAIPPTADCILVTGGPFRVVRNPTYVAMLAAGLGAVMLAANVLTIAGWPLLLASLMLTARAEEPLLCARFGAAYTSYASHVGRFTPGVGRLRGRPPAA